MRNFQENPLFKLRHLPTAPFPIFPNLWEGDIYNARITGDVCNVDPDLVNAMPLGSASVFNVTNEIRTIPFQVVKAESLPFLVSVKFVPKDRPELKLETNIYRKEVYQAFDPNSEITPYFNEDGNILRFDLVTRAAGKRHPYMRAKKFIPWTLKMFEAKNISYCMGEWEPGSDNHSSFYSALSQGLTETEAIQSTWTYAQYSDSGFGNIKAIAIDNEHSLGKKSPEGYPPSVVRVLFGK